MKLKITLLSLALSSFFSHAQSEFINDDFGMNGVMCVDIPGETIKMGDIIKLNGSFYGVTDFLNNNLVRFSANGSLATSFGNNGYIPLNIGPTGGSIYQKNARLLTTSDNKLIIITSCEGVNQNFIAKTDVDGNLISSFGNSGYVSTWNNDIINFLSAEIINNEIVLLGSSGNPNNRYLIVAKYDLDGNPVASFGVGGRKTILIDSSTYPQDAHYFSESGRIVVLSSYLNFSTSQFYSLATMYDVSSGTPSADFGINGSIYFNSFNGISINPKTLYSDSNAIFIAGWMGTDSNQLIVFLNKYDIYGELDTNFGPYQDIIENADNISVQTLDRDNGNFVITGYMNPDNSEFDKIFIQRITEDGLPDNSFGNNGTIINPMDLAYIAPSFKTIIEGDLMTVATLSLICTSDDQPKPAVVQFRANELSTDKFAGGSVAYYPNPVKDNLTIVSENQVDKLELYNVSGKLVNSISNPASNSADLSQLQSGLYFVKVFQNGCIGNIKVIKE